MNMKKLPKIFKIDYLINADFDNDELKDLFDTPSLKYSLIIGMFREIGDTRTNSEIIKELKKDPEWFNKYSWSLKKFNEFEEKVKTIMHNVYQYYDERSKVFAQNWMTMYSLKVKKK